MQKMRRYGRYVLRSSYGWARIASLRDSALRLERGQFETHWSKVSTQGTALLAFREIRALHFQKGPIGIEDTPHFGLFRALFLSSQGSLFSSALASYTQYMTLQHKMSALQLSQRLERTVELFKAFTTGAAFSVLVRPVKPRLWLISDGFHRAACIAAAGQSRVAVSIHFHPLRPGLR
jgi:hypothetical protein